LNHDRILASVSTWPNTGKALAMECLICRELKRTYDAALEEYVEARSSASYQISKRFAAVKNVDMERARYELQEHRALCIFAREVFMLSPQQVTPMRLRHRAA
jgi:hypothetical protein